MNLRSIAVAFGGLVFSHAHAQSWTNSYGPANSGGIPGPFMALDCAGNVYLAGPLSHPDNSLGYVTLKYASNGAPLWTNIFNGPGSSYVSVQGIALGSNAVYVTGGAGGTNDQLDFATLAYSTDGVPLWTNWYGGPVIGSTGFGVATALNGTIYVTGYLGGAFATMAYSNNGALLWTNIYDPPGNNIPYAVAVAPNGDVSVMGFTQTNGDFATAIIAYSSAGAPLWTNIYAEDTPSGGRQGMAIDAGSRVYVAGMKSTVCYSPSGAPIWTNVFNNYFGYIAIDSSSNCYVAAGLENFGTVKYSAAGNPLWTNYYSNGDFYSSEVKAITLDASSDVIVTGEGEVANEGGDFVTVAYSTDGVPLWTNRFNGPSNDNDIPTAIAANASGDIYISGVSPVPPDLTNYANLTLKFPPPPTVIPINRSKSFPGQFFEFEIYGRVGSTPVIQSTSDFLDWASVATITLTNNLAPFVDTYQALTNNRFYRTKVPSQ